MEQATLLPEKDFKKISKNLEEKKEKKVKSITKKNINKIIKRINKMLKQGKNDEFIEITLCRPGHLNSFTYDKIIQKELDAVSKKTGYSITIKEREFSSEFIKKLLNNNNYGCFGISVSIL